MVNRFLQRSRALVPAIIVAAAVAALATHVLPAQAAPLKYFGGNLAFDPYGQTFGSGYNTSKMDMYLNEFRNNHLNFIRVWICESFYGLSFDSNNNCTGISQTYLNNAADFAARANSRGICVEFVFLNYDDVGARPWAFTTNRWPLINNALIPLAKKLQPYNCQIDLINEGNLAGDRNYISWSQLRQFCQDAKWQINQNGVNRWVTMSSQNSSNFTQNFGGTIGGLGFDFYEYHCYNSDGSIPVSSGNVGGAPLYLNEFGRGNGWTYGSYNQNKSTLGSFMNNAQNQGYLGAAFWTYVNDGDYQLRGNALMGDISWWGSYFGH